MNIPSWVMGLNFVESRIWTGSLEINGHWGKQFLDGHRHKGMRLLLVWDTDYPNETRNLETVARKWNGDRWVTLPKKAAQMYLLAAWPMQPFFPEL